MGEEEREGRTRGWEETRMGGGEGGEDESKNKGVRERVCSAGRRKADGGQQHFHQSYWETQ